MQIVTFDPLATPGKLSREALPDPVAQTQGVTAANPLASPSSVPQKDTQGDQRDPNHRQNQPPETFQAALKALSKAADSPTRPIASQTDQPASASASPGKPQSASPEAWASFALDIPTAEQNARNRMRDAALAVPAQASRSEKNAALAYLSAETGQDPLAPGLRVDRRA